MYISRFFIKSASTSFNSLDFFHLHLLAFTFSPMIINPFMLLRCTHTLSPICEWDLNGIWNGLTTDLERTYNGPEANLLRKHDSVHHLLIDCTLLICCEVMDVRHMLCTIQEE